MRCIHDNGPEFMGAPFMRMLEVNGIKDVPTTVKNPQANANMRTITSIHW